MESKGKAATTRDAFLGPANPLGRAGGEKGESSHQQRVSVAALEASSSEPAGPAASRSQSFKQKTQDDETTLEYACFAREHDLEGQTMRAPASTEPISKDWNHQVDGDQVLRLLSVPVLASETYIPPPRRGPAAPHPEVQQLLDCDDVVAYLALHATYTQDVWSEDQLRVLQDARAEIQQGVRGRAVERLELIRQHLLEQAWAEA